MQKIFSSFVGMDRGTRTRTITAAITALLDFLSVFGIISFTDEQTQAIQKLVLVLVTGFVWAYCSHYKNNDYTEEACEGTGLTRLRKDEKKSNDVVFTEDYETEDDEDAEN